MTRLSLGFSPCPNDTHIFYAMVHYKIDTEGLSFDVTMADVEELNNLCAHQYLEVSKLSYHAWLRMLNHYQMLDSGSALGWGVGPLLICRNDPNSFEAASARIAIPGELTTAAFLLKAAYPNAVNLVSMLFSDIEAAVRNGEVDAGVIIHENRFTYADRGLHLIADLGSVWEEKTEAAIPLGGIALLNTLNEDVKEKVQRVLKRSVEYAFAHPEETKDYVRQHAQEMDEEVMKKHINLYVNEFTRSLTGEGKAAIKTMIHVAQEANIISDLPKRIFV